MKRLLTLLSAVTMAWQASADNFVLEHGQSAKIFQPDNRTEKPCARADRLLGEDYHEVFGGYLIHTVRIDEARIIACPYDNADLRKYAKLRGISFEELDQHPDAVIFRVNNGGKQLFIVGGSEQATAYGLMTLSREWGVSPFGWWLDAPSLPIDRYELDVVYERKCQPSVAERKLCIEGADIHDARLQDLLMRLRATSLDVAAAPASDVDSLAILDHALAADSIFGWTLAPSSRPYEGLSLALDHPERIRMEGVRAFDHGCCRAWQVRWQPQLGGEFQLTELFDMAWDVDSYRDAYHVDALLDQHYSQATGLSSGWSQLWNDYYDLAMLYHLDQLQSVETLRRAIGESQSLSLQLSMELQGKVVPKTHAGAYFRTVEYPLNMFVSQIQRLCNTQLLQAGTTLWSVEDCLHRMQLLAREINDRVRVRWRQMLGSILMPESGIEHSAVHLPGALPDESSVSLLYRSDRPFGTKVQPYQALHLPLNYQASHLHLQAAFLPVRSYGRHLIATITVDNGAPQTIVIDQQKLADDQQLIDFEFDVDPEAERHTISLRTSVDGIYLQRLWLLDVK